MRGIWLVTDQTSPFLPLQYCKKLEAASTLEWPSCRMIWAKKAALCTGGESKAKIMMCGALCPKANGPVIFLRLRDPVFSGYFHIRNPAEDHVSVACKP